MRPITSVICLSADIPSDMTQNSNLLAHLIILMSMHLHPPPFALNLINDTLEPASLPRKNLPLMIFSMMRTRKSLCGLCGRSLSVDIVTIGVISGFVRGPIAVAGPQLSCTEACGSARRKG